MSKSTFPLLKPKDILGCLKQLEIPLTLAELKEPSPKKMQEVYEKFMDYLMGISKEELRQPQFQALHVFEFPELHENSLPELMVAKTLLRLLKVCGLHDASLKKILEPTYQGTRKILSALINFAKFREARLVSYQQFSEATDQLMEQKQAMEDERVRLDTLLQQQQALRDERAPQVNAMQDELRVLNEVIVEKQNEDNVLQEQLDSQRKITEKMEGNRDSLRSAVEELRAENSKLQSKVVRSPEKLQRSIALMSEQDLAAKQEVEMLTGKLREIQSKHAAALKMFNKIQKRKEQVAEIEEEMARQRTLTHELKDARNYLEQCEKVIKDELGQEEHMKKAIAASQDKIFRQQRQFEQKRHTTQMALAQVVAEKETLLQRLGKDGAIIQEHQRLVQQRKREMETLQAEHSREEQKIRSKYQHFLHTMEQYHSRMEAAMTAPLQRMPIGVDA